MKYALIPPVILVLSFVAVSATVWAVLQHVVGCPGLLHGPWTLASITHLKHTEYLAYWAVVLSVPLLTVLLSYGIHHFAGRVDRRYSTAVNIAPTLKNSRNMLLTFALYGILFPIFIFFFSPRDNPYRGLELNDEGLAPTVAQQFLHGKQMYRDIYFQYGPLMEIAQPWLAGRLFGWTMAGMRMLDWMLRPLAYLGLYALAFVSVRRKWLAPLLLLLLMVRGDWWIPLRIALPLFSLACVVAGLTEARRRRLCFLAAGLLGAAAFFYSMEGGLILLLSVAGLQVLSLVKAWRRGGTLQSAWMGSFFAGVAMVFIPFFIWLLLVGRARYFVLDIFLACGNIAQIFGKPTPILCGPLRAWLRDPWILFTDKGVWLRWWLPVLLYIVGITWGYWRIMTASADDDEKPALVIGLFGVLFFTVAIARCDYDHWLKASSPVWAMAVLFLDQALSIARNGWRRRSWGRVLGGAALAGVLGRYLLGFISLWSVLQMRPQRPPHFAASSVPPELRRLGPIPLAPAELAYHEGVIRHLHKFVAPGEYLYIFGEGTAYYFLASALDPTSYAVQTYVAGDPIIADAIAHLKSSPPRCIMADAAGSGILVQPYQHRLADYILAHYRIADRFKDKVFLISRTARP